MGSFLYIDTYVVAGLLLAILSVATSRIIYNAYFHPLSRFPGPFWWRVSRIPFCQQLLNGTISFRMLELHNQYGSIVRVAPNELSFSDTTAWKDIHGHRPQGGPYLEKWNRFYRPVEGIPTDIVNAPREEHSVLRRQFSHGFSDRSLREQEHLIVNYVDLFISRMHDQSQNGAQAIDLSSWFNYLTFDIIGDLVFGEPFGCLEQSDYHPWVRAIFQMGHVGAYIMTASHYPTLKRILLSMVPESAKRERENHLEFTKEKLKRRLALGEARPDLIQGLVKKDLDMGKLEANAGIMIMAGSETTATLLAGLTYYLTTRPETLNRLTKEIRSAFASETDINIQSVNNLPYLSACLNEALRLYPPVPNGLPRIVPKGGAYIAGHFIPEQSVVAVHQWAMYHTEQHFKKPFEFHPERWIGDPSFGSDHLDALQPFHVGPRNCLGRNFAYVEMRIIMARLLWNFDLLIADEGRSWIDQKIFLFWKRGALPVRLVPVHKQ